MGRRKRHKRGEEKIKDWRQEKKREIKGRGIKLSKNKWMKKDGWRREKKKAERKRR